MQERSLVSVKVEPRSTSRLSSALFILPLFYLRDYNLRALPPFSLIRDFRKQNTRGNVSKISVKKASVEINL